MKQQHLAFSYIRFSSPEQARGDSLRRQTQAVEEWCRRNGATLDDSTSLHDLGKSAFTGTHRSNPDRHALAAFLKLVEGGKVARGSYLVIENLDRLSREHIQPALLLLLGLLQKGIRIVQLRPAEMVLDETSDAMRVMMAIMELQRGHGESLMKSQRVGQAWAQKKERARRGEPELLTRRLPGWIEERDGKMRLIPVHGAIVKRIYTMAANGYSATAIVRRFRAEGVQSIGKTGKWASSYVSRILSDRRPVGEFQPRGRGHNPDGPPIPDYYPRVVSEEEWIAARAALAARPHPTRTREYICLFAGLLRDARDGTPYHRQVAGGHRGYDSLVNRSKDSDLPKRSFPLATLEAAVLYTLQEIDPAVILGEYREPDETAGLIAELAVSDAKTAELEAELLNGNVPALARTLRTLEEKRQALAAKLDEARKKQMHPLDASWSQAKSLLAAIRKAKDQTDARTRLRYALRRIVESMQMLIVPRGIDRIAVVQIHFFGGERRDFLIYHRAGKGNGAYRSDSSARFGDFKLPAGDKRRAGKVDLRDTAHVAMVAAVLEKIDLADLDDICTNVVEH
jgi:DNA invertase Pin-like site-specific DNA recombinase